VLINTDSTSNFVEDSSPLEQLPEYGEARGSPSNLSVPFTNLGAFNHIPSFVFTNGKIMIYQTESDNVSYGGFGKGRELYVSDGTLTGTSMIKDLNPDGGSIDSIDSYVHHAWWNDVLYLALDDGTDETGQELWRTDGTAAGTYIVKDIRPGSTGSGVAGLTLWKDHLYFTAYDGNQSHGYELWQSDGTENGTFILKDIYPGDQWTDSGWPRFFTAFNDKLYFQATDEEHGTELWTTDGTENGTTLVVDIRPGTMGNGKGYPSNPGYITVFNDYMYFSASNDTVVKALWKSDGTANGTSLVKDIYPGGNSDVRAIVPSNLETSGSSP
jgi:ELWxxDGT repeat protein